MIIREAIADALAAEGADTLFALMGGANQDFMCDMGERHGVRIIHGRHEAGVVSMADGYARFSGQPGFATVTAGPGLSNTATALAVARDNASRLLLVAGETASCDLRNPQRFDQTKFAEVCAAGGGRLQGAEDLDTLLAGAFGMVAACGPYVLNLPIDLQAAPIAPDWSYKAGVATDVTDNCADKARIDLAVDLLAGARRPVVLAGRGAVASCAGPVLRELASLLNAPLITTVRANGLFAGHPLEAGVSGGLGDGRAKRVVADCDVLLVVGSSLHPLSAETFADGCRIVRIDSDPAACSRSAVLLHGDAAATVRALDARLRGSLIRGEPRAGLLKRDAEERLAHDARHRRPAVNLFPAKVRTTFNVPPARTLIRPFGYSQTTISRDLIRFFRTKLGE